MFHIQIPDIKLHELQNKEANLKSLLQKPVNITAQQYQLISDIKTWKLRPD
jgi:hypothetical protein